VEADKCNLGLNKREKPLCSDRVTSRRSKNNVVNKCTSMFRDQIVPVMDLFLQNNKLTF
jgi:hypothetical protein